MAESKTEEKVAAESARLQKDKSTRIILLVEDNPKKPGSDTRERFKLYKRGVKGMTVHEFLTAGGKRVDLPWDSDPKREFIKLVMDK